MRRGKWSIGAEAFCRHRRKPFVVFTKLPPKANQYGLRSLFVGDSLYFNRREYSAKELSAIVAVMRRYNNSYSVQFLSIKHPDDLEIARIA